MPLDLKKTFPKNWCWFFKPIFHGKKTGALRCPKSIPKKNRRTIALEVWRRRLAELPDRTCQRK